jgi:hypothetical protein
METSRWAFRAEPLTVQNRAKFREEISSLVPTQQFCNIVVDPRVYRGATYDRRSLLSEQVNAIPSYPKRHVMRTAEQQFADLRRDGYSESLVQTEDFDGTVIIEKKEESIAIQTEPFVEKPIIHRQPAPVRAIGVKTDVPGTTLFDFNLQVRPIVSTLVQKALIQAQMEVTEEAELESMNRYLKAFDQKARADAAAIARLEQAEAKKFAEKEARVAERKLIESAHLEVRAKVLARGFAEWFVSDLQEDSLDVLAQRNYFYDETERAIESQFLPWLAEATGIEIARASVPDALAESAIEEGDQFYVEQCNEIEIHESVVADQKENKAAALLRRMIPEDKVGVARRKSKQMGKKKKQAKPGEEEEDQGEGSSAGGTESGDSASV